MNGILRLDVIDEDDVLGLGCAVIAVEIDYTILRGDPGCRRDANGDGWPPEPDSVEFVSMRFTEVSAGESGRRFSQNAMESAWLRALILGVVNTRVDARREEIETSILEEAQAAAEDRHG